MFWVWDSSLLFVVSFAAPGEALAIEIAAPRGYSRACRWLSTCVDELREGIRLSSFADSPKPPGDIIFSAFIMRGDEELVAFAILHAVAMEKEGG